MVCPRCSRQHPEKEDPPGVVQAVCPTCREDLSKIPQAQAGVDAKPVGTRLKRKGGVA